MIKKSFSIYFSLIFIISICDVYALNDLIEKVNSEYKGEKYKLYTSIFNAGFLKSGEINKLEKLKFSPGEILCLSIAYNKLDDSFDEFFEVVKIFLPINEILFYYELSENEVEREAENIIDLSVSPADVLEFKESSYNLFVKPSVFLKYEDKYDEAFFYYNLGCKVIFIPVNIFIVNFLYEHDIEPVADTQLARQFTITRNEAGISIIVYPLMWFSIGGGFFVSEGTYNYRADEFKINGNIGISSYSFDILYDRLIETHRSPDILDLDEESIFKYFFLTAYYDLSGRECIHLKYGNIAYSIDSIGYGPDTLLEIGYKFDSEYLYGFETAYELWLGVDYISHRFIMDYYRYLNCSLIFNLGAELDFSSDETAVLKRDGSPFNILRKDGHDTSSASSSSSTSKSGSSINIDFAIYSGISIKIGIL